MMLVSIWRHPVKSMMGEELTAADITERGLLGDRTHALVDRSDGQIGSAKKWPRLFEFRAAGLPPVRITLPDGTEVLGDQGDLDSILSRALGREVTLATDHSFFDCAPIHLLTTASLDKLHELYPEGNFDLRRFRPNLVVKTADGVTGFVEDHWIGKTIAVGNTVRLRITDPCGRCVMTTLPQGDLPKDPGILRTAAHHHHANVGVYAEVLQGGVVRLGDAVTVPA